MTSICLDWSAQPAKNTAGETADSDRDHLKGKLPMGRTSCSRRKLSSLAFAGGEIEIVLDRPELSVGKPQGCGCGSFPNSGATSPRRKVLTVKCSEGSAH